MKKTLVFVLLVAIALCCLVSCSDVEANAKGVVSASAAKGIARQPEAEGKINALCDIAYYYIDKAGYKAQGIGDAGAAAAIGIARQPEATPLLLRQFMNVCLSILGKENIQWFCSTSEQTSTDLVQKIDNDLVRLFDRIGLNYSTIKNGSIYTVKNGKISSSIFFLGDLNYIDSIVPTSN